MASLAYNFTKFNSRFNFGQGSAQILLGELTTLPTYLIVSWRG